MGFTAEYAVDGKEAIDKILVGDGVVNHFDVVSMGFYMLFLCSVLVILSLIF